MSGKITKSELSNGLKAEIESKVKQSDLIPLQESIVEVEQDLMSHEAESMPHQFTDGSNVVYKYGFKANPAKDGLVFVYEEV